MKILKTVAIALILLTSVAYSTSQATPITTTVTDRISYEALSLSYCADVARAAAYGRSKKLDHYEVIDTLNTGLAQRPDISELTRKVAERLVTVLVTRVYLDKVPNPTDLEQLSRTECLWANQLLQGMTSLQRQTDSR